MLSGVNKLKITALVKPPLLGRVLNLNLASLGYLGSDENLRWDRFLFLILRNHHKFGEILNPLIKSEVYVIHKYTMMALKMSILDSSLQNRHKKNHNHPKLSKSSHIDN